MAGIEKWQLNENSKIKYVLAVMSGKGGVGKSLTSSLIATHLNKRGLKVGILDCDLTGPSIPETFGIDEPAHGSADALYPNITGDGIKLMSINLLLPNKTDPVIWRGPVLMNMLQDFWTKVEWGELDCLVIDMPPGTGDVPLSIFQSFRLDGVIVVSTPSKMANVAVDKAIEMALRMNINILGEVQNMAYYICDNCKTKHYIFGKSPAKKEVIRLAEIPFNEEVGEKADSGKIEDIELKEYQDLINSIIAYIR
ncbi:MAG: Mrp/NBP35 family ATP-binding protein [Ezakiella sp.]|nr:Mrp/NBP35 family ATP-binding protein [Ezakiella sp.]